MIVVTADSKVLGRLDILTCRSHCAVVTADSKVLGRLDILTCRSHCAVVAADSKVLGRLDIFTCVGLLRVQCLLFSIWDCLREMVKRAHPIGLLDRSPTCCTVSHTSLNV